MITTAGEVATGEGITEVSKQQKLTIMKGTIKWYDRVKGYGFIQTEDEKDIFIHRSGLDVPQTELETGQAVEFEVEMREKGPVAIKVKKVE